MGQLLKSATSSHNRTSNLQHLPDFAGLKEVWTTFGWIFPVKAHQMTQRHRCLKTTVEFSTKFRLIASIVHSCCLTVCEPYHVTSYWLKMNMKYGTLISLCLPSSCMCLFPDIINWGVSTARLARLGQIKK